MFRSFVSAVFFLVNYLQLHDSKNANFVRRGEKSFPRENIRDETLAGEETDIPIQENRCK